MKNTERNQVKKFELSDTRTGECVVGVTHDLDFFLLGSYIRVKNRDT